MPLRLPPPRRQPEKAIQRAVIQLLMAARAEVYVLGVHRKRGDHQGTMQTPGIPDILAFLPPADGGLGPYLQLWIEVKAPAGRESKAQRTFKTWCIFSRQSHITGGVDEVMRYLKTGGWIR